MQYCHAFNLCRDTMSREEWGAAVQSELSSSRRATPAFPPSRRARCAYITPSTSSRGGVTYRGPDGHGGPPRLGMTPGLIMHGRRGQYINIGGEIDSDVCFAPPQIAGRGPFSRHAGSWKGPRAPSPKSRSMDAAHWRLWQV